MALKVYPGARQATHQISLSDGVRTYGLRLADGPRSIQEIPMTPSTIHFSAGGTKFGDWEPGMSHIEQRTWAGGRANDSFVDDMTRFFDSKMAWTLTPGKIFPVPLWKFSNGYQTAVENMPGDLGWRTLYGDYTYISELLTHENNWADYDRVLIWIRRVGTPGDLDVRLMADNSGDPSGTEHASDSLSATSINEHEVYLYEFDWSSGTTLSGTTTHLRIDGNLTDNAANHWEIGVDIDGDTGKYYYTHSAWNDADFSLYYRVLEAEVDKKWHFFELQGAQYAVDEKADGTASDLYINGDRGVATAGAATTLTDSNKSWTADAWIGAWVKIIAGTGVGQVLAAATLAYNLLRGEGV